MQKLVASTFVAKGELWLFLDSNVVMKNGDSLTMDLNVGEMYVIHWFVTAIPGSTYSITISSPKEAQFQLTRGIGGSGKDFGSFLFKA